MRHGILWAAAILTGLGSGAVAAPVSYDCDTAAGAFSEIRQKQDGPSYAVAGKMGPRQLRAHERWLPTVRIWVEAADGRTSTALQLVPEVRGGTVFAIVVTSSDGDKKGRTGLGKITLGETLAFSIRAGSEGVRVEAGGKSNLIPVAIGVGGQVGVSCSTGEFDFETLDLDAASH